MKKSIIATGAASLALAAMPVVGVFATPAAVNTLTDNITVTVPSSCSMTNVNTDPTAEVDDIENNYAATIYNGNHEIIGGAGTTAGGNDSSIGVSCNVETGADAAWYLTAVGAGDAGYETNLHLQGASDADDDILSGSTQGANHPTSGATSDWAFRVVIASPASAHSGFTSNSWTQVPASAMTIADGTGSGGDGTFTMDYGVYVSGSQPSGTYKGAVLYTLYNPAA